MGAGKPIPAQSYMDSFRTMLRNARDYLLVADQDGRRLVGKNSDEKVHNAEADT